MIKQPHYIGLEEARQLLTQMGQPAGGFAASVRFSRSEPSSLLTRRWREMDSNHRYRIRNNPFGYPVRSRNSPSATKTGSFVPGTDGSNPFPSSAESAANLTSSLPQKLLTL